jgi:uncharacterized protein YabN with tetrapyrrole methylase and pyrophosphatase domain
VPRGSLTVVGTGIAFGVHLTPQARTAIECADDVFYLLAEETAESWFKNLNPSSHSLRRHYAVGRERKETYERMVEEILGAVRNDRSVCAAFYGHPGVFASPSHDSVRRARAEGFDAVMLPGISAEDCLFADLGVDPGQSGCQSYEASDFLLRCRVFDTSVPLILWQVAFIGITMAPVAPHAHGFSVLVDHLLEFYPESHRAIVYEASPYPVGGAHIEEFTLATVRNAELSGMSTLYLPPAAERTENPELRARLLGASVEAGAETV